MPDLPETLAFVEVVDDEPAPTTTIPATSLPASVSAETVKAPVEPNRPRTEAIPTSTAPPMSETTTTIPTTSTTPPTSDTTATTPPTTAAPTTAAPPTAPPSTTPPTTAGPTSTTTPTTASTTTAQPTTTAAPTTITTAPTTSTTAPTGVVLYLKNPGTGDTEARWDKTLATDGPDNSSLPNYNTDEDSRPGSRFLPTIWGFNETSTTRIEAFRFTPGTATLSGPTTMTVWLATDGGATATVDAQIALCRTGFLLCTGIAAASAQITTGVADGFEAVTFDFGSPTHGFDSGDSLVVRLVTAGTESIHVGFDADPTPSRLETTLS